LFVSFCCPAKVEIDDENQGDGNNLMLEGEALVEDQCAIMRNNLHALYGSQAIVDPLDP